MKTFNHYKSEIEDDTEKTRLIAFDILEFIDFTNYDTIVESVYNDDDIQFQEVGTYDFIFTVKYLDEQYIISYDFKSRNAIIYKEDDPDTNISLSVDKKLLSFLNSSKGRINLDSNMKPKIFHSNSLINDIKDFLNDECKIIDHMFVYDHHIDIDNTVRANSFLFIYELNLAIDLKGTYKNGDLRIKKLNLYNIRNINKNLIEKRNDTIKGEENGRSIEEIKYFFEHILIKDYSDDSIMQLLNDTGLGALEKEDIQEIIKLNTMI